MTQPAAAPISITERIQALDILRGFALFGILLVNMMFFAWPVQETIAQTQEWSGLDKVAVWIIALFGDGKFFSLFSFLFGFGLYIQMTRIERRGVSFVPLYLRRLFVLLLFGLAHALLFWMGDILAFYAILGMVLVFFRHSKLRTLIIWTVVVLGGYMLLGAAMWGLVELGQAQPGGQAMMAQVFTEQQTEYRAISEQAIQIYSSGAFGEIMTQRLNDYIFMVGMSLYIFPKIFAMFLLGLYVGRRGIFQDISTYLPLLRRAQKLGLTLGLIGELIVVILNEYTNVMMPSLIWWLRWSLQAFSAPLLTVGYMSTIILLMQNNRWRKLLSPLAEVGRMALSNYILQTLICTTIFYSYGLGLYGKIGPMTGLGLTIVIYLLQIPLSGWWLKRFQFGPLEWLWRSLTYLKLQPMRVI